MLERYTLSSPSCAKKALYIKGLRPTVNPTVQPAICCLNYAPHFFEDTVLEVAEWNIRVMEIKYFEFYCKSYYFDEYFELKMIL